MIGSKFSSTTHGYTLLWVGHLILLATVLEKLPWLSHVGNLEPLVLFCLFFLLLLQPSNNNLDKWAGFEDSVILNATTMRRMETFAYTRYVVMTFWAHCTNWGNRKFRILILLFVRKFSEMYRVKTSIYRKSVSSNKNNILYPILH